GTAGSSIPNVVVQVDDTYGNVVTTASGSVTMSIKAGGPQASFTSGTITAAVSAGVATFSNLVVNTPGSYTLTATPVGISGVASPVNSSAFTVSPAAASTFTVSTPATQNAGTAFSETIPAHDAYGNIATGFTGAQTIVFSGPSNSPNATAPNYPASVTFASGVGTASVTLVDVQSTTLTATQGSATGTSAPFTVTVGATANYTVANPGAQTVGTAFNDTITATDIYGNTATSYTGAQTIVFSGPSNSPNATAPNYP